MDEALGLAIRLRSLRRREAVADGPGPTDVSQRPGAIGQGVVGEESPNADAAPEKPGQRALEKRCTGRRIACRQHLA